MAEMTLIQAITDTMWSEMERDEKVFVLGQDCGRYGGVFKATAWKSQEDGSPDQSEKMYDRFGPLRVLDAPLAENAIIGGAIGSAIAGYRPIAEIQFMDFIDCAMGHIVNQAGVMSFKTNGSWCCPLTIRTPFGGDIGGGITHSQSNEAWFCHAAGLIVMTPSTVEDAAGLLRTAIRCDDPVLFIEHKKLYRSVKGEAPTDPDFMVPIGKARIHQSGSDITFVAYGNMLIRAMEATRILQKEGVSVEVIDPRTLWPLDLDTIVNSVCKTGRCVVISESHSSYGFSSEIAARVQEGAFWNLLSPIRMISAPDTPYPFDPAMEKAYLPSVETILKAAKGAMEND
ncbi:alpha-ketoacid dehydrogenase subunit beta [bacterium]|nr:alpha-ketoacid dehydrogenase subunit beta [bacterium]